LQTCGPLHKYSLRSTAVAGANLIVIRDIRTTITSEGFHSIDYFSSTISTF